MKRAPNGEKMKWNEESFDHGRKKEISGAKIYGVKKALFNSEDFGALVISTYSEL